MFVIRKRVNSVNVQIHLGSNDHWTTVSGYAFPFGRQFHSVSFAAKRGVDVFKPSGNQVVPAEAEIGFGGNSFSGTQAARVMAAATVAFDQGNYFADLMNEMADNRGCGNVLLDAVHQGDPDHLLNCLLLIASKHSDKDQKAINSALCELVKDGRPLGLKGMITPKSLEALETNQKYGLMKLCRVSDLYECEDSHHQAHVEASRKTLQRTCDRILIEGDK